MSLNIIGKVDTGDIFKITGKENVPEMQELFSATFQAAKEETVSYKWETLIQIRTRYHFIHPVLGIQTKLE